MAVVSLRDGASGAEDEIRSHFSKRAPHYMVPKTIHVLDELPKTASGKIDRSQLKKLYAEG